MSIFLFILIEFCTDQSCFLLAFDLSLSSSVRSVLLLPCVHQRGPDSRSMKEYILHTYARTTHTVRGCTRRYADTQIVHTIADTSSAISLRCNLVVCQMSANSAFVWMSALCWQVGGKRKHVQIRLGKLTMDYGQGAFISSLGSQPQSPWFSPLPAKSKECAQLSPHFSPNV